MRYIADLHIHSPFSRATSKDSTLRGLSEWARIKGINLVATGDFTHPGWLRRLKEELVPSEPGFYKLRDERTPSGTPAAAGDALVRFILSTEISSIYKRHGQVRKVHNLLFVPDFASVEKLNAKLAAIGNIESDGRPILGLDSRDLLEILLEEAPEGFLVPAHIWTPWFSLFGSKSGFNSVEECFGDLSSHIFALETGLSSDPPMNRLVSALDRYTLISNSDCHSPSRLGREANLLDADFNYFALRHALRDPARGFLGTIEFFPEEGKYHLDGHRKCQVRLEPEESRGHRNLCPACGKPLTIGVTHRVMELADRSEPRFSKGCPGFRSIIPLPEVLGEILGKGPNTKTVQEEYGKIIGRFGSEFHLLLSAPIEDIGKHSAVLGEAIRRIRAGEVVKEPGYDGEFGVIRVFAEGEQAELAGQAKLFGKISPPPRKNEKREKRILPLIDPSRSVTTPALSRCANEEQKVAATMDGKRILVCAGPGTGKTFTLIERIVGLLRTGAWPAAGFVAITFTNKAAEEIRERLHKVLGERSDPIFVGTFHRFCLGWLRKVTPDLIVIDRETRSHLVKRLYPALKKSARKEVEHELDLYFDSLGAHHGKDTPVPPPTLGSYLDYIKLVPAIDLDGVIPYFLHLLRVDAAYREQVTGGITHLFVDEFQDVNESQYALVSLLGEKAQVFAIGDPNQAIYGFRGSDARLFFRFAQESDGSLTTRQVNLRRNYRSAPTILEAARQLIENNHFKADASLVATRDSGPPIEYYQAPSALAEAEYIVQRIEEIMGGISHFSISSGRGGGHGGRGKSFGDFAVLYRMTRQAQALADALDRRGIPYQQIGSLPFFMRPIVKNIFYWVRSSSASASGTEIISLLRHFGDIGPAEVEKLEQLLLFQGDIFSEFYRLDLSERSRQRIKEVKERLQTFAQEARQNGIAGALAPVVPLLGVVSPDADETRRFLELATAFGANLESFALHLKEHAEATVYDERAEAVSLMTLHGSKGLEFPVVFITGLEEGVFPPVMDGKTLNVEEERRLFYVGMTRAQERLILTTAARREIHGRTRNQNPSPFLDEIPKDLLNIVKNTRKTPKKAKATQMNLF